MNIKTVTITTGMNTVVFGNSANVYYWVKNIGSTDITVGSTNNAENHAILKPDNGIRVDTFTNTVYISGAGTVEIYECNTPICPFKSAQRGGDGYADVTATGNPVQLDGLQEGVPFNSVTVSGKNLIGIAQAKVLGGNENSGYNVIDSPYSRTIIQKLQPNTTYTVKRYDSGNRFRIVLFNNEPSTAADITAKQLVINTNGSITEYTFTTDTAHLWFAFTTHSATSGDAVEPIVQLEYGSTVTAYEPPITGRELTVNVNGVNYTITPDTNPYIIPNDIRQQDGLNNISVSAGTLSVTGVRKNAAIKRIWDEIDEIKTAIIVSNGESE